MYFIAFDLVPLNLPDSTGQSTKFKDKYTLNMKRKVWHILNELIHRLRLMLDRCLGPAWGMRGKKEGEE